MADSKENYLWDRRGEKIQLKHQQIQESFINDPTVAMTSDFSRRGGGGDTVLSKLIAISLEIF